MFIISIARCLGGNTRVSGRSSDDQPWERHSPPPGNVPRSGARFGWFQCGDGVNEPIMRINCNIQSCHETWRHSHPPGSCLQGHICVDTAGYDSSPRLPPPPPATWGSRPQIDIGRQGEGAMSWNFKAGFNRSQYLPQLFTSSLVGLSFTLRMFSIYSASPCAQHTHHNSVGACIKLQSENSGTHRNLNPHHSNSSP